MSNIGMLGRFTTADQIAKFLRLNGIKGQREKKCDCPLSRYAAKFYPQAKRVEVEGTGINVVYSEHEYRWHSGRPSVQVMRYTPAMRDFVRWFDNGQFSDLEETA